MLRDHTEYGKSAAQTAPFSICPFGTSVLRPSWSSWQSHLSGQAWTFKFTVEEMQRMNSKSG